MLIGSVILWLVVIGIPLFFYLAVSLFFYIQPIMLEGQGPTAALGRSRELVRGSWWRIFGIGVVFVVIAGVLGLIGSIPAIILGSISPVLADVATAAVQVLILPISYIGATLVYFDLRVRKEGYTLDMMALEVGH